MKTLFRNTLTRPVMSIALAMAGLVTGGATHALGTGAGTAITNLATLNYSVGGAPQTAIESKDGVGNTAPGVGQGVATSFVVDNKRLPSENNVGIRYELDKYGYASLYKCGVSGCFVSASKS